MQKKCRSEVRPLHLTQGSGKYGIRGEAADAGTREIFEAPVVSQTSHLCVKIPQIQTREIAIVFPVKSNHFQAAVPAVEFARLYLTPS